MRAKPAKWILHVGHYDRIASTTRRGYTDAFHEMLDNVGLVHMNWRVYDPVIGRFLSTDPIVATAGNSQSLNPYSYVQNRPLTLTDPTGLAPTPAKPGMPCIDNCNGPKRNLPSRVMQQLFAGITTSAGTGFFRPGGSSGTIVGGSSGTGLLVGAAENFLANQAANDNAAPSDDDSDDDLQEVTILTSTVMPAPTTNPITTTAENLIRAVGDLVDTGLGVADLGNSALACEAGACLGVWQGANQNWYSQNWGGNGATGARLSALEDTAFFENFGTTLFFGTTLLNVAAFAGNVNTGNTSGAVNNLANIGVGSIGMYGGALGKAFAAGYTASSIFIAPYVAPWFGGALCWATSKC